MHTKERVWKQNTYENDKGTFTIFYDLCKGCGLCIVRCPTKVIYWSDQLGFMGTPAIIPKMEGCIICKTCQSICPEPAIKIERKKQ